MKKEIDYLNFLIQDNDSIIIALSGGPDSMCLLSLIMSLKKKLNIICAHVNHKVRNESDEEYNYLKKYCNDNNLTFEGIEFNKKVTKNFEEEARKFRYVFFNELRDKYNAKYIMIAHHADDLIETILMRISRGSNLSGYAGIKMQEGFYLRPLLHITKKEILTYLKNNNIKYFLDKTNEEDEHTRNRYRHNILPFLKKENENIHKKYIDFSEELLDYCEFVDNYINNLNIINKNEVGINDLLKQPLFIQKKIIEIIIKAIQKKDLLNVSNTNIEEIMKLVNSKKDNCTINLSNNYIAKKSYKRLSIIKNNESNILSPVIFDNYYEDDLFIIKQIYESNEKSNNIIRLNQKEIKLPLIIRSKNDLDKMNVKNLRSKKINDIFINEKIDKSKRNNYPLLVDSDDNILWIPGLKKSKFDKEKKEKYDIILSCERK